MEVAAEALVERSDHAGTSGIDEPAVGAALTFAEVVRADRLTVVVESDRPDGTVEPDVRERCHQASLAAGDVAVHLLERLTTASIAS